MIPSHASLPLAEIQRFTRYDVRHRIRHGGERSLCGLRAVAMAADDEPSTCRHCIDIEESFGR